MPGRLLGILADRAQKRRVRDRDEPQIADLKPGGIPDPGYRGSAMLTYAYSVTTQHFYVGYSGSAGGMVKKDQLLNTEMAWRRYERVTDDLDDSGPIPIPKDGRVYHNCGEAAALSIAISWDEKLENLIFASFGTQDQLVGPCPNCLEWIGKAKGYYKPKNDGWEMVWCR